ncbi:MAG TPA: Smr/MutS family protein [Deltaproteobacteria bacterium]|nr:Smr/MutS family protein [Deltaproteobacteria bacterium]HOI07216.1 Smr/MutS family protein [Deltaproteobacteria bacterium]
MREDLLEFSALKGYIKTFVASDMGSSALDELQPFSSWEEVELRWGLMREMMALVVSENPPHFSGLSDIRELLDLHEGAMLEGKDIVMVAGVVSDMARLRRALEKAGPALSAVAEGIEPLDSLTWEIGEMLTPNGDISDEANPFLRKLRKRARMLRTEILEHLQVILDSLKPKGVVMEDLITVRNERYVIPLRHDYGSHIKGITHDYSRSSKTAFVEPLAVVEENNTLNQVRSDIKEEENKILQDLTLKIFQNGQAIRGNLRIYGLLDLIHACARWAVKHHAVIPALTPDRFELRKARHPILMERLGKRTVPLDIELPKGKDCLIISGPNAGGKTVALKTLGLLVTMAKSGLAIPAEGDSVISPVGSVWVEMDTSQDIQHDLSSFTAHALSLKRIYEGVAPGDLVLLDEPGTGTDPQQGAAIAVSCIDAFRKKGAIVVVTSHSDLVKLYGLSTDGAENAATAFDDTGLKPLYRLQYGVIGQSRAFDILKSVDFPAPIIRDAQAITAGDGASSLARAMEEIAHTSSMRIQAEEELERARLLRAQAEEALQEMEKEKVNLSLRYRRLMEKAEALSRTRHTKEEIEQAKATKEASELEEIHAQVEPAQVLEVRKGSTVALKGTGAKGSVVEVSHDSAEVLMGDKRLRVGLDQIEAVQGGEKGRPKVSMRVKASSQYVLPINVVGMRVDEAMPVIERAVDQALLSGQRSIEIIHGAGTGRLKGAIREFLKGLPVVKGVSDSPMNEGGGNKTIVMFEKG